MSFNCKNGVNGFVWNFLFLNGALKELSNEELCRKVAEYQDSPTSLEVLAEDEKAWEGLVPQPTDDDWWNGRLSIQEWWTEDNEEYSSGRQPRVFEVDPSYMCEVTRSLLPLANAAEGGKAFKVIRQADGTDRIVPITHKLGESEYLRWKGTPLQYARQRPCFDGKVDARAFLMAHVS